MVARTFSDLLPPSGPELAVRARGRDVSRSELRGRVEEIASVLRSVGIERGAAVGVMLANDADAVAALFAVWSCGAVVVPLNRRTADTELAGVIAEVDLFAVVTSDADVSRAAGRQVVAVGDALTVVPGRAGFTRHPDGVATVSFTSGTTGKPKPVPLLAARVMEGFDQILATLRAKPADEQRAPMPNLVPVPLSLWNGIYQVLFAFNVGAAAIVMDGFDTLEFAALVRRFGIRSTVLPPAAMVMLADDERLTDLAPLKYVRGVSAPLSPMQARRFRDRFGIAVMNGYGQTELGGEVIGWSASDTKTFGDDKLGAVGRSHHGVEASIDVVTGELLIRIPGRFDEWQHTGDIARIDDDGFVWIEGRMSEMINRGGLKIHPGDVEEVLRLSPSIEDAAVVGLADDRLGEVPVAYVVESASTTDDDLTMLCRQHLAAYKVPVRFVRVGEIPRNEAGKVMRRELTAP